MSFQASHHCHICKLGSCTRNGNFQEYLHNVHQYFLIHIHDLKWHIHLYLKQVKTFLSSVKKGMQFFYSEFPWNLQQLHPTNTWCTTSCAAIEGIFLRVSICVLRQATHRRRCLTLFSLKASLLPQLFNFRSVQQLLGSGCGQVSWVRRSGLQSLSESDF